MNHTYIQLLIQQMLCLHLVHHMMIITMFVKNEWNRYLEIAEKNKNKCLIPCYKDVDEYDIPKEFAGLKVCQLGNDDTFNNIMAEIANVVKPNQLTSQHQNQKRLNQRKRLNLKK